MHEFSQRVMNEPSDLWDEWVGISPESLREISIERGITPLQVVLHYVGDDKQYYDLSPELENIFNGTMDFIMDNVLIDFLYSYLEEAGVAEIDDDNGIWISD